MSYRRIEMFEYRQIIHLMKSGLSDRAIAKQGYAGRHKCQSIRSISNTNGWLEPEAILPCEATLQKTFESTDVKSTIGQSSVEPFRATVLDWQEQGISMSIIHQALVNRYGYEGSYDCIRRFMKNNAPQKVIASTPLHFDPAEAAQVDFGKGPIITDVQTGEIINSWFFVMTLCFSRHMYVEVVPNQTVMTWIGCHRRAFEFFGGLPKKIIIDNAKCAIIRACTRDPEVQRAYAECAQGYGFIISPCPVREPQMKGRVESGVKYVKGSFLPLRTFQSLSDANRQAKEWILGQAGHRKHGSTYLRPLTSFAETEKHLLLKLPDVPPELAQWRKVTVHGDCHIQFDKCRYSVPYHHVKQELWIRASETTIRIYHEHNIVSQHRRLFVPGQRSTITGHLPPNGQAYLMKNPTWCRERAKQIGSNCTQVIENMFADKVLDNLRSAQGIIALSKTYGNERLNAACGRAIAYQSCHYKTIKNILKTGCEYGSLPDSEAFDLLATAYTNGRFIRSTKETTKH